MLPTFAPQLVAADGAGALRAAIREPDRYALEPKMDGVGAMVTFDGDRLEIRGKRGQLRSSWLRCRELRRAPEALSEDLPIVRDGTVLDGEPWDGSFHRTMQLLSGNRPLERGVGMVVFDMPAFAGCDLRGESWQQRRDRLEVLARASMMPLELSPLEQPSPGLADDILSGALEGIVVKDRRSPYRSGSRKGWAKVKAPDWHEEHRERFGRPSGAAWGGAAS